MSCGVCVSLVLFCMHCIVSVCLVLFCMPCVVLFTLTCVVCVCLLLCIYALYCVCVCLLLFCMPHGVVYVLRCCICLVFVCMPYFCRLVYLSGLWCDYMPCFVFAYAVLCLYDLWFVCMPCTLSVSLVFLCALCMPLSCLFALWYNWMTVDVIRDSFLCLQEMESRWTLSENFHYIEIDKSKAIK